MSNDMAEKKHVLIISGEPLILAEIKMDLMNDFDISIAASSDFAITALGSYDVSAVVVCIGKSRDKAFSDFNTVLKLVKDKRIPIILLAEKGNDDDETAAFEMGAVDYSARRRGAMKALIQRISLRISASEQEKRLLAGGEIPVSSDMTPEDVLSGKSIILADDVELNRDIVGIMLSDIDDLTIDMACDGMEVVELFKAAPDRYSLILMDVHMPEMDGLEATRVIRGLDVGNARTIPIVALTADTEEAEVKVCLNAGMNETVEKPVNYERLVSVCAKLCK